MRVITFVTSDYIEILQRFFIKTLPGDIDSVEIKCVNKNGYFRHDPFSRDLEKIRTKFIIEQIQKNWRKDLMMIDADVIFSGTEFSGQISEMLSTYDILFQNNTQWYNFGVFALKCWSRIEDLFHELLRDLDSDKDYCETLNEYGHLHDQHYINDIVRRSGLKHGSLPLQFFGGHFSVPMPKDWILYHATNTQTMQDKIDVLCKL